MRPELCDIKTSLAVPEYLDAPSDIGRKALVAAVLRLAGAGDPAALQQLEQWRDDGALKDWQLITKRSRVAVGRGRSRFPARFGVPIRDRNGVATTRFVRPHLFDMTWQQLRDALNGLEKQRATLSRNCQVLASLLRLQSRFPSAASPYEALRLAADEAL